MDLAGGDDALIQYSGSNADRSVAENLYADRLGSIVASYTNAGSVKAINSYDEFGMPGPSVGTQNTGRFLYTGQIYIPELGQYHYKARAYSPGLGRFMQTDPIGYGDGLNMYGYVGNDSVNRVDPLGLFASPETCFYKTREYIFQARDPKTGKPLGNEKVYDVRVTKSCIQLSGDSFTGLGSFFLGGSGGGGAGGGTRGQQPQSQKLSPCQIAFLSDQLAARGMPTDHLGQVRFVSGLDSNANIFSRRAFNTGHVVTQGNTIYVPPWIFDTVANFLSRTGFEEVYHTSQFASEGSAFYPSYAANSIGGWLATGDGYNGNLYEVFAKRAASDMRAAAGSQMCQN